MRANWVVVQAHLLQVDEHVEILDVVDGAQLVVAEKEPLQLVTALQIVLLCISTHIYAYFIIITCERN